MDMDLEQGGAERGGGGELPPSFRTSAAEVQVAPAPSASASRRTLLISSPSIRLRRSKSRRPKRKLQSDLALYDDPEVIESFLRDEVGMDGEMTKTAFRQLLLDEAGVYVEDALLEAIFAACDQDGNGLLDATELAAYVHEIRPSSQRERRKYVALSCLLYPPFYLSFFCLNASLMSATTNLRERPYGDLHASSDHPFWQIASLSDLIGLCGYVILKWEEERLKHENLQQARVRLVQWVNVDLPLFIVQNARRETEEGSKSLDRSFEIGEDLSTRTGLSDLSCSDVIREQDCIEGNGGGGKLETGEGEWSEDPPPETMQSVPYEPKRTINGRANGGDGSTSDTGESEQANPGRERQVSFADDSTSEDQDQGPKRESRVSFADNSIDEGQSQTRKQSRQVSFADESIDEEQDPEGVAPREEGRAQDPPLLPFGFVTDGLKKTGDALKGTGVHVADGAVVTRDAFNEGVKRTGDVLKETGAQVADGALATGDVLVDGVKALAGGVVDGVEALKKVRLDIERDPDDAVKVLRAFVLGDKTYESADRCSDDDKGLDVQEMRLLLETMGVFLAAHAMKEIFLEIDDDGSGTITIRELLDFTKKAEKQLSKKSRRSRYGGILKRCCLTIGWWTSWSFITGACFWVTLSFVEGASELELQMYLGLTVILYLCGALGNLTNLYRATEALTWQINSADMMLRAAAISVGLARMEGKEDESEGPQNRIRTEALEKLEETMDHSNRTEKSRDELRQMRRTIRRGSTFGSGGKSSRSMASSGDVSSEGEQQQAYDEETIAKAQEEGARELFEKIDVSDDGQIDEKELFDALESLGVMIPTHALSRLFHAIDVSGDGQIEKDELVDYVKTIKPGMSNLQRRLTTVRYMIRSTSFYLVLSQVFAGSAQVHAAWVGLSTVKATRNLFLAGSFGWAVGSLYFIATWPKNKGQYFDQLQTAKFSIKASILAGCGRFDRSNGSSFKRRRAKSYSSQNQLNGNGSLLAGNVAGRRSEKKGRQMDGMLMTA
ncbi:hypothetical protein ACHAXT_002407 [Thalassiosira profunda]